MKKMSLTIFLFILSSFSPIDSYAVDSSDYVLQISYYRGFSGTGEKMRRGAIYEKGSDGKAKGFHVLEWIHSDETNELREFSYFEGSSEKRHGYSLLDSDTPSDIKKRARALCDDFSIAGGPNQVCPQLR